MHIKNTIEFRISPLKNLIKGQRLSVLSVTWSHAELFLNHTSFFKYKTVENAEVLPLMYSKIRTK